MIATARDLRFHAKEILEATMRGESVIVTLRGKPAAKMIPFPVKEISAAYKVQNKLFGMWKDRTDLGDPAAHVRDFRKGRQF
jgi:prevent-host-death family protein